VYLACYTAATWSWTFGLIGAALRFCSSESPARRYLADASYWVYLAHLPVVLFLQALVSQQPWHWTLKFPLVLGTALAFLFATYHLFVRRTFVGVILNGRRYGKVTAASVPPAETPSRVVDGGLNRPIARLSEVRKTFGAIAALDRLSLEVRPGEILAVLGPNGAGKSTAIALLLGLQEPTEGAATLFDRPPANLEARYPVGVMMQEAALAPELKVRELIALTTSYYPAPYTVDEVLELTRTAAIADRQYQKLSGGQKRLAQFALALCGRPALLFLDEPTVGLDAAARDMLWSTLRQVVAQGTAVVLTTHYLEEAEALADRVAVLAKGRLIAQGSVDEVRSVVDRKRVRCLTGVPAEEVRRWPGVQSAATTDGRLEVVATDADGVVRRLFLADEQIRDLEVHRAGLAEAFAELTREAA
jgi:ABC-type multidrug transport system ATPase subunit